MKTKVIRLSSTNFINNFLKKGKSLFTLEQAIGVYGQDRKKAANFLSKLIKRGILARIKPGVYLILLAGQEHIQISNWPIIARELSHPGPYFISHYSAMRLHGMTTHPLFEVYITMTKRRISKKINNIGYHFIYSKAEHFWGGRFHWVTKQDRVEISDLERTILDGLERPDLCGGLKEVVRGIWIKQKEIDWKKMQKYSNKSLKSVIKRLGFIIELLGLQSASIPLLLKKIEPAKDYILLDPKGPKEGKYLSRWRIQLNLNIEELKASIWE